MNHSPPTRVISRRSLLAGAAGLGFATLLFPHQAHAGVVLEEILGSFKHVGGNAERRALDAAIDAVVSDLGIVTRGVARLRLQRVNPIPSSLVLAADKQSMMLAYDSELYSAPLDGKTVQVCSSAGEKMDLHLEVTKDGVDQVFSAADASRTNRLRAAEGKLVVDVVVRAPQLPRALSYRLTYART